MSTKYTDELTAEGVLITIANDGVELSQDKIKAQRDDWRKWAISWLKKNGTVTTPVEPPFKDDF